MLLLQTCPVHTYLNKLYFKCYLCLIELLTVVFYLEFECLSLCFFFLPHKQQTTEAADTVEYCKEENHACSLCTL